MFGVFWAYLYAVIGFFYPAATQIVVGGKKLLRWPDLNLGSHHLAV